MKNLIDKLAENKILTKEEFIYILDNIENTDFVEYLFKLARDKAISNFGNKIYTRGLIEFSNYCVSDCFYCGIRKSNKNVDRYRLSKEQIMECCEIGYELGFRTFVLQGGEDSYFTDDIFVDIIKSIREKYPMCAITLSIGEKSRECYQKLFDAGANRFLLRHETYDSKHYSRLHPPAQTAQNRQNCLQNLKEIGFQVGTGIMVGSPWQNTENIANDLMYISTLKPQMVGIGPFIPHKDTPFFDKKAGCARKTTIILAIVRLILPNALIPATTALGTIADNGRELGILAGANVLMPNLSPLKNRKNYSLYDNKIGTGDEAAENREKLRVRISKIGYELTKDRGDFCPIKGE